MAGHTRGGRTAATPWGRAGARALVIAHRGASAYRPELSLAALELAVRMGADVIEVDLVSTADGALVARHEPVLDHTTDVRAHLDLRRRAATRTVDGIARRGVFVTDLTLAELRRLRAIEPAPSLRPRSAVHDGRFAVPTLEDVLHLRARLSRRLGRQIGICLEPKHAAYHAAAGTPLESALVAMLRRHGLDAPGAPAAVQSFDPRLLRRLHRAVATPLIQLVEPADAPAHLSHTTDGRPFDALCTPPGLREIAGYAVAVGVHKHRVIPVRLGGLDAPTSLVDDAHAAGLAVHAWTFRSENAHLPPPFRVPPRDAPGAPPAPADHGDALAELALHLAAGVDAVVTDHPDTAAKAVSSPSRARRPAAPR